MRQPLPTRKLRPHPDLDQLKRQAKELLKAFVDGDESAAKEVRAFHPAPSRDAFALHDAQLVLARSYGYETWPKLKAFVDGIVRAHKHEMARLLLERGADANGQVYAGGTPLSEAYRR